MSGAVQQERPRTAVPLPDLKVIDEALAGGDDALKEAVKTVRPADLGRDLSRRPMEAGRRILQVAEDRRGAAMLVAAHPRARPGPRLRHPRPSGILTLKMTQSPVPAARR